MTDTERIDWLNTHKWFRAMPANTHVTRAASLVDFEWLADRPMQTVRAKSVRDAIDAAMSKG